MSIADINNYYNSREISEEEKHIVLFGISMSNNTYDGLKEDLNSSNWYDFEIYKYKGKYRMFFETNISFNERKDCVSYIHFIFNEVTKWMKKHKFSIKEEANIYEVFTEGYNINSEFDTLEDLYKTFKLIVNGFSGEGIALDCDETYVIKWINKFSGEIGFVKSIDKLEGHFNNTYDINEAKKYSAQSAKCNIRLLNKLGECKNNEFLIINR